MTIGIGIVMHLVADMHPYLGVEHLSLVVITARKGQLLSADEDAFTPAISPRANAKDVLIFFSFSFLGVETCDVVGDGDSAAVSIPSTTNGCRTDRESVFFMLHIVPIGFVAAVGFDDAAIDNDVATTEEFTATNGGGLTFSVVRYECASALDGKCMIPGNIDARTLQVR